MKLCRFELIAAPGEVRSGIVHNGRIYETAGAEPVAIHEAVDVRPLSPTGTPPSLRIFRTPENAQEFPFFFYGNPNSLIAPSQLVSEPIYSGALDFEPYIAVVLAADGFQIPIEEVDGYLLGYTLINFLVTRDVERTEKAAGFGPGRSYDVAAAIGPVLTTPDEMDDVLIDSSSGRQFKLTAVARVNGVEVRRGDVEDLPWTLDQMVAYASESVPLRAGDILCAGPIVDSTKPEHLSDGDEVQLAVEKLGTLSLKIGS